MTENDLSKANPALQDLQVLIGKWEMELSNAAFLPSPSATVKGEVFFDWLENEAFVSMRMGGDPSISQGAIWLISRDEASPDYKVFYYDDRKVSRIYEMSFSDKVWKLWRQAPNFSQRFEGKIINDGNKILAKWENSNDGQTWEHDFDVTYTRLK
jgi:hypothetical protein